MVSVQMFEVLILISIYMYIKYLYTKNSITVHHRIQMVSVQLFEVLIHVHLFKHVLTPIYYM